ncbi:uncharacterized protein LOC120415058 isoform X1 [Culex pipiens pallens]|uniref:uncharacterized protein LOC120415058 isoform X1 n=1 Tax=Culex pipiens pallens TaxID=42434 RepID=UPI001953BA8C|nr:uncharacterized protein LOC120415058 isoform X1 [Culex pipiens pallens]
MSCFKIKWKVPSWLRLRRRPRQPDVPVLVRIVPHPPPPSPEQKAKEERRPERGPGFYRRVFRGELLQLEAWEELNTDLPYGAAAYYRSDLSTYEDEIFCRLHCCKDERDLMGKLVAKNAGRCSCFGRGKTREELERSLKKKMLRQICRDIRRLGKYNRKLALGYFEEIRQYLAAVKECENHVLVRTWEDTAPEDMDPLQGTSDSYYRKEFRKAPLWNPKLCEPWAEPAEPLTPEELEVRARAQRNRAHSELSPNDRDQWKLSKWHYERRPEHEQEHYLPNHELPSRPGQFELEDLQRAFAPPLPASPANSDEMASTDSEEVREAIAAEHRESRRAGKREFSLPAHLKNFDPFAEDNRPKIPTVVASAEVTVQKPFPVEIAKEEVAEVEEVDDSDTSFVDSELDLIISVDDLLDIAMANLSADEQDTVKDAAPEVKNDPETAAPTESPAKTVKLVMIEVEPPTPTNVVIVQAEIHPEPADDEVAPPLPVKKTKYRERLVHFEGDPDKIEVDQSFIEPPKAKENEPELGGTSKVPRCLRNIRWSFFKPLQHPKNPPGMSKRTIVEQDLARAKINSFVRNSPWRTPRC